jgi:hypothetical protein
MRSDHFGEYLATFIWGVFVGVVICYVIAAKTGNYTSLTTSHPANSTLCNTK